MCSSGACYCIKCAIRPTIVKVYVIQYNTNKLRCLTVAEVEKPEQLIKFQIPLGFGAGELMESEPSKRFES